MSAELLTRPAIARLEITLVRVTLDVTAELAGVAL